MNLISPILIGDLKGIRDVLRMVVHDRIMQIESFVECYRCTLQQTTEQHNYKHADSQNFPVHYSWLSRPPPKSNWLFLGAHRTPLQICQKTALKHCQIQKPWFRSPPNLTKMFHVTMA